MTNRKRTFRTRSSYAVLARMDEASDDDDSISELEYSSEEDFDELDYSIFDTPAEYISE